MNKKHLAALVATFALVLALGVMVNMKTRQDAPGGLVEDVALGVTKTASDRSFTDAIGSESSRSTLTSSFTGGGAASSSAINAKGFPNVIIAGNYVPKSYGAWMYLLLERSVDNGVTYKPYMLLQPTASSTLVYSSGTSTSQGTPFIVPANPGLQSVSGTAIPFSFDLTLGADFIKVSAKEQTTSTAGVANVQVLLNN